MKTRVLLTAIIAMQLQFASAQWQQKSSGFTAAHRGIIEMSASDERNCYAIAYDADNMWGNMLHDITITHDGGNTWNAQTIDSLADNWLVGVAALPGNKVHVLGWNYASGGGNVFFSTNSGLKWKREAANAFTNPASFPDVIQFFNETDGVLFGDPVNGSFEIYTTNNGGIKWSVVSPSHIPAPLENEMGGTFFSDRSGNTIWCVTVVNGAQYGRIFQSDDKGANWYVRNTNMPEVNGFGTIKFRDKSIGLYKDNGKLYRTTNGGTTWNQVNYSGTFFCFDFDNIPGIPGGWISTGGDENIPSNSMNGIGSSISYDDGNNWVTLDTDIDHTCVEMTSPSHGYSGGITSGSGKDGVFVYSPGNDNPKSTDAGINDPLNNLPGRFAGIGEISTDNPEAFVLQQNYPNPFQGSTSVNIYREFPGPLNLMLYDVAGTKLAEYHNGFEKGFHSFEISSSGNKVLFLVVSDDKSYKSIKIICTGENNESSVIRYLGQSHNSGNDSPMTLTVTTAAVTNITQTSATSGGNVTSSGGPPVTARGVCWNILSNPTISNSHTTNGSGTGTFVSNMTGLTGATIYYVRAYATNNGGTIYGNELTFTTLTSTPTVTTAIVTNIAPTTATSGGTVTSDGGFTVTARGVCWNTSPNPTTANNYTTDGNGTGTFISNLTGLTPNTLYYVRAYATNSLGTAYGNEINFSTSSFFVCGTSITITHLVSGGVAPVNKTVTYGTVTNIPGETSKCWITSNLGSDHQATSVDDASEASAGWYWQFDLKQGYKVADDGKTRTPRTKWIGWWIGGQPENSDWQAANDPCSLELSNGWRIPTYTEWYNVDSIGNWTDWNGPWNSGLKLHAAGGLWTSTGELQGRGMAGHYWSSTQNSAFINAAWQLGFNVGGSSVNDGYGKLFAFSLRCIRN